MGIHEPSAEVVCSRGAGRVLLSGTAVDWKESVSGLLSTLRTRADVDDIDIEVSSKVPAHSGFGSHTSLVLGIVEAVSIATQMDLDERQIIDISGRGRTSGVGVQTYFRGGVAYDFGIPGKPAEFLPSAASESRVTPVFGHRIDFPEAWQVLLALPNGERIYGEHEIRFFRANTPLHEVEALRAVAHLHHGVIPSIVSCDLASLAASLTQLHKCGFKALELEAQSKSVQSMYRALVKDGFACGMSSFGPLLYAIVKRGDLAATRKFEATAGEHSVALFGPTTSSEGRKVSVL